LLLTYYLNDRPLPLFFRSRKPPFHPVSGSHWRWSPETGRVNRFIPWITGSNRLSSL